MQYDLKQFEAPTWPTQEGNGIGLSFDSEAVTLRAQYFDELSLFRAKKAWVEILELNFLLERDHDYKFETSADLSTLSFQLSCSFQTACGRYAFWRLVNDQAPEIQYLLETAHVPNLTERYSELMDQDPEPTVLNLEEHGEKRGGPTPIRRIVHWLAGRLGI